MKKIIGVITRCEKDKNDYEYYGINKEVFLLVDSYDCMVLPIVVNFSKNDKEEFEKVKGIIDYCDGVILQGGDNYYSIDILITKYLYDKNIPTLGICLGMQIMAACFNGELKQIGDVSHYRKAGYAHIVEMDENSKIYDIIKAKRIMVNSRHTEYIANTDLDITAYSEDGIIESVEDKNKLFFIGVQWHPESNVDLYNKKLFDYYFNVCNMKRS